MAMKKLSENLDAQVSECAEDDLLDVVVELRQIEPPKSGGSQQEKIAEIKKSFDELSGDVEKQVTESGGTVLDRAWINQTLRAKMPAKTILKIAEHQDVQLIDVPGSIEPDSG